MKTEVKTKEVATTKKNGVADVSPERKRQAMLVKFNNMLAKEPPQSWINVNKAANNTKYIPIRIVEDLLRSYFGTYQVEMIGQPQLIANSVVVSVHLKVYHPILNEWLTYAGTGAVPIQLRSGANPMDHSQIIPTALQKNVPSAKAFAISNAAKSLGRVFGAMLNNSADEQITTIDIYKTQNQQS